MTSIVIFDGVCMLCAGVVQFIIRRDPQKVFKFASLQSKTGAALLATHGLSQADALASFVVLTSPGAADNVVLRRSDAALFIGRHLDSPWPALSAAAACIPRLLRDFVYDRVAANRYTLCGKKEGAEKCLAPTRAIVSRFVSPEEVWEDLKRQSKDE